MFYISLDHQVILLLLMIFSSYIFISSLTIRLNDILLKTFGLAFFIPIVLGCYSFLIAPINRNIAALFLDLSWITLLLMLSVISLIRRTSESTKVMFLMVFLVPLAAILLQNQLIMTDYRLYEGILAMAILLLAFTLTVFTLLSKKRNRARLHGGIFTMAAGFMLFMMKFNLMVTGVLTSAGLVLCAWYFYENSFGLFYNQYKKNSEELSRISNSVQMEVIRRVEEIERSNRKLLEISKTDSMTGFYVKSALLKSLESLIERSPNGVVSLMLFDIDKFKGINDTMGHQIGDKCIKAVATLAQGAFRKEDLLGRYGGDEFIVVLPGAVSVKAYVIADRFRQLVQSKSNPTFTISVGVATYPQDGKSIPALIEAADKALYESKQKGRNRVTCYATLTH